MNEEDEPLFELQGDDDKDVYQGDKEIAREEYEAAGIRIRQTDRILACF